jgi:CRISPR-associated protein Csm3
MNTFWQFENRWLITATLRMKTALSVGSRASLLPAGSDLPVIKTPEGVPFIPGSSLKGVIRTYVEQRASHPGRDEHAASRTASMGM